MKDIATNMLTGFKLLELSNGPSGSYAGRLYQQSGAEVTKLSVQSNGLSPFRDEQKNNIVVNDEQDLMTMLSILLEQSWDIILWDSHCSKAMNQQLQKYVQLREETTSCVGIIIDFPPEVQLEEERSLQALAGWTELTGDSLRSPLLIGGHPATSLVGAHAATAGLLPYTTMREKGNIVHIHALTIAISALEGAFSQYYSKGEERVRNGIHHSSLTPMVILPCNDGWSFVGSPVDEQYVLLESWAELAQDQTMHTAEGRLQHRLSLEKNLAEWTKTNSKDELFLTGQAFRMPFGKVQDLNEVKGCPHLQERDVWQANNQLSLPWKVRLNHFSSSKRKNSTNLRIVDLTSMWSGPYCTRLFADLGIEVIKIEAPHRPDGIRSEQGAASPFFRELNRNKKGITLNLNEENDRQTFLELIEHSDILIDNYSPRVLPNFGLQTEKLWEHQPNLIHLSLSAFGQTGIYKDYVGYGPTLEALSGIASLTHYEDGEPNLPGFSISDIGAGIHGAFALLVAVYQQKRQETGIRVDLSQYEVAIQFVGESLFDNDCPNSCESITESTDLKTLFRKQEIQVVSINDHAPTLGMPWSCVGWELALKPAPELGEHNDLLNHFCHTYISKSCS